MHGRITCLIITPVDDSSLAVKIIKRTNDHNTQIFLLGIAGCKANECHYMPFEQIVREIIVLPIDCLNILVDNDVAPFGRHG